MTSLFAGRTPFAVVACFASLLVSGAPQAQTIPVAAMLPPVVVTATRFPESADSLPFGVSVLTADDLRHAGVSTVNEALMKLLGVPGKLDFYGGGDYGLDLRGFGTSAGSNQVVIVDGVRISEADLGGTRLAGIPIDSVDRIEVIRGSAAVLYGEGATGGAIVITTKAAGDSSRSGSAYGYTAMGSHSLLDARAGVNLASGGFSVDVAGNRRTSDGHRDNFRASVEGLSLTAQWRSEWLRVGASHVQDELHTGLPGALTAAQYDDNPRQSTHPDDRADIDNNRDKVFAEATLGNWQLALDAGRRSKTLLSQSSFPYAYDIDARNRSLRARHSFAGGGVANTVTVGVDRNEWDRTVRGGGSSSEQQNQATYLQDDFKLPGGTRLSAGVRSERATKADTSAPRSVDERFTAWSLGVVQPLSAGASVFGRVGRSFRFPNVDEIGFATAEGLRPQSSRDIDLGGRWAYDGGRAELRFYRNALSDEIGFDPNGDAGFGPFGANVNFDGNTRRQGVELELTHELSRAVQVRLNAAARQAKFTGGTYDGHDIALVPRRTVSFGADWTLGGGHQVYGLVNMVSSQAPDFANVCSIPAYTTADARYAYRQTDVELSLAVANITDKKYYTLAYGCTGGVTTSIYPEAGRSVVASVRVSF